MRYMLTDDLWAALGPHVAEAKRHTCGQQPRLPDRAFFEALLYWARTGIPWRDLPAEFGSWDAVYNRFRRWVASGGLRTHRDDGDLAAVAAELQRRLDAVFVPWIEPPVHPFASEPVVRPHLGCPLGVGDVLHQHGDVHDCSTSFRLLRPSESFRSGADENLPEGNLRAFGLEDEPRRDVGRW